MNLFPPMHHFKLEGYDNSPVKKANSAAHALRAMLCSQYKS